MEILLLLLTALSLIAAAIFGVAAWRARAEAHERSAARVAALASALAPADAPDAEPARAVPVGSMFEATAGAGLLRGPAIVAAVAAVLLIAGGMVLRSDSPRGAPTDEPAALELVSMRHTRDGRTLRVTGLVRNPDRGVPLVGVAALVFAFDRGGEFVASGRGALDLPRLGPGEESSFAVTIPDLADVGRYRVSFRTDVGLVRHVDRRAGRQLVKAQ